MSISTFFSRNRDRKLQLNVECKEAFVADKLPITERRTETHATFRISKLGRSYTSYCILCYSYLHSPASERQKCDNPRNATVEQALKELMSWPIFSLQED